MRITPDGLIVRDGTDQASALLIDFDNGAELPDPSRKPNSDASDPEGMEELACRTVNTFFA